MFVLIKRLIKSKTSNKRLIDFLFVTNTVNHNADKEWIVF